MDKRKCIRASYTRSELEETAKLCYSVAETLRKLGVAVNGGNHTILKKRIAAWGIDTAHFDPYRSKRPVSVPTDKLLVANSKHSNSNLKARILAEGLLLPRCSKELCPTHSLGSWLGKPVPLQLDHINGDSRDNRIENLRFLCPNCHVLTPTWGGRNYKHKRKKKVYFCADCSAHIFRQSTRCKPCSQKGATKFDWPSPEDLVEEVNNTSIAAAARRIGASYNTVKKRMKNHPVRP